MTATAGVDLPSGCHPPRWSRSPGVAHLPVSARVLRPAGPLTPERCFPPACASPSPPAVVSGSSHLVLSSLCPVCCYWTCHPLVCVSLQEPLLGAEQRRSKGAQGDGTPGQQPQLVRVTASSTELPVSVSSLVMHAHSTLPQVRLREGFALSLGAACSCAGGGCTVPSATRIKAAKLLSPGKPKERRRRAAR